MIEHRPRELLISKVNFIWYPITLVPVLALLFVAGFGYVPPTIGLIALFLLFFWLFSLGFAIHSLFRKPPKEPRQ